MNRSLPDRIARAVRLAPLLTALLLAGCPWPAPEESPQAFPEGLSLQASRRLSLPETKPTAPVTWRDPVSGITLIRIPGGCFRMGSDRGKPHEGPVHTVCLDDFWLASHETTQKQWQTVQRSLPLQTITDPRLPVENVSWNEIETFVQQLNTRSPGRFRLPTEAEWEYACRDRGRTLRYCATDDDPAAYAWHMGSGTTTLHPVGGKRPNALGLHDMNGNVWEWVADWYKERYDETASGNNPTGPVSGSARVFRGGSVLSGEELLKATARANLWPDRKNALLGFRLAGTPP
ncbi:MAG: SUMF1/EgtB/PvdO family nonheme iron enzyme [Magnetococcales bacterium]|nr:SUMF1/EgtB/PvdO family nonheme iron enzyme [Magnetococcales bacterium]